MLGLCYYFNNAASKHAAAWRRRDFKLGPPGKKHPLCHLCYLAFIKASFKPAGFCMALQSLDSSHLAWDAVVVAVAVAVDAVALAAVAEVFAVVAVAEFSVQNFFLFHMLEL